MWLLLLLTVVSGQTFQGTGSVNWFDGAQWPGSVVPVSVAGTGVITVDTQANVTVDQAVSLASLTLGASGKFTSLIVQAQPFSTLTFAWLNGYINMSQTASFTVGSAGTLNGASVDRRIIGGTFRPQPAGLTPVTMTGTGSVTCDQCKLGGQDATWNLDGGINFANTCVLLAATTISGGPVTIGAGSVVSVMDVLTLNSAMTVTGQVTSTANMHVGSTVTVGATGSLGQSTPSTIDLTAGTINLAPGASIGGGTISVDSQSAVNFQTGGIVTVTANTNVDGAGPANVAAGGEVRVTGAFALTFSGGGLNVDGTVSVGSGTVGMASSGIISVNAGGTIKKVSPSSTGKFVVGGNGIEFNSGVTASHLGAPLDITTSVYVHNGASVVVDGDTTTSGAGSFTIIGDVSTVNTLTLGSAATYVNTPGTLTVGAGNVVVQSGAQLNISRAKLQRSASATGTVTVAAGGSFNYVFGATSLDAALTVNGNALVDAEAKTTVIASSTISGSGTFTVSGELIANAALAISTKVVVGGNLTANSAVTVNIGDVLVGAGGAVQSNGTGTVVVAFGGSLQFTAGPATSRLDAAVTLNGGELKVNPQATVAVGVAGGVSGSGLVNISGQLNVNAAWTVSGATIQLSGDLRIAGGVVASLGSVTMGDKASWTVAYPASGNFVPINTTSLTLDGDFKVQLPSTKPTQRAVLVFATGIIKNAGFTASVIASGNVGRRLLGDGAVLVEGNTIVYDPTASPTSAASKNSCLFALLFVVCAFFV